jgi:glycosyltransferase involved in cell wall biosynthesis
VKLLRISDFGLPDLKTSNTRRGMPDPIRNPQSTIRNPPAVSVVVPVYNTERYIADTIDSLLKQTFIDFELIVIDDGSTDRSPAILRDLASRDARIRLTVRENHGIVRTRNELLEQCRGTFMAVNDSDDLSMPDRLEKQVAYMQLHPECVLLGSRVMLMDPFSSPVAVSGHKLTHDEIEKELLSNGGGWALVQSAIMLRVDVVRRIGGYQGEEHNLAEDHDLFVRLAEVGKVANLPEPLVWYRRHHTSLTHTLYQAKQQKHVEVKQSILRGAYERRGLRLPETWTFDPWKPTPRDVQSRQWGWAALKHGNVAIARRHATDALKHSPLSLRSWKLMACALRGR